MTTKPMSCARQKAITASGSAESRFTHSATCAMPALPGAQVSRSSRGLAAMAQASACSRPPEPMISTFMAFTPAPQTVRTVAAIMGRGLARARAAMM
jgi:hypothetical protein